MTHFYKKNILLTLIVAPTRIEKKKMLQTLQNKGLRCALNLGMNVCLYELHINAKQTVSNNEKKLGANTDD